MNTSKILVPYIVFSRHSTENYYFQSGKMHCIDDCWGNFQIMSNYEVLIAICDDSEVIPCCYEN